MDKYLLPVLEQHPLAKEVFRLVLDASAIAEEIRPGQFFHLRCGEGSSMPLRRPISLCDLDESSGSLTLVYRVEGEGTAWLAQRRPGEILDVLGPLGNGFPLHMEAAHVALIGGGIGIPPLLYTAKRLAAQGVRMTAILGYPERERSFLWDEFQLLGRVLISTEDGSLGHEGRVTHAFQAERQSLEDVDVLYSCGPTPMLQAVKQLMETGAFPVLKRGYLSLEERMGCGVGACLACYCPVAEAAAGGRNYRKICSDGPVFDYREILLT